MLGAGQLIAATAAAVLLAGCSSGGEDDSVTVYSSMPLQSAAGEEGAAGVAELVRGQQVALAEAGNRAGRFRIRYVSLDDSSPTTREPDPQRARRNARRAAEDPNAVAYIGELHSGVTVESLPITNRAGLLQVSPLASYSGLTRPEGAAPGEPERFYPSGKRTFGRVIQSDLLQAAAGLEYMRRKGVARAAVFHDGSLYGRGLARILAELAPNGGLRLLDGHRASGEEGAAHEIDWSRAAAAVAAEGADAIYYAGFPEPRAMKGVAATSLPVFGTENFVITGDEMARAFETAGIAQRTFATAAGAKLDAPVARAFARTYEERYGQVPSPQAYYAYESMRLVIEAIRRAGDRGDDREAVRRAFFTIRDHDSSFGRFSIDPHGDVTLTEFAGYGIRDGRWAEIDTLDGRRFLPGEPAGEAAPAGAD